jgi:thiol-disulfide isomerase/thioredoxin
LSGRALARKSHAAGARLPLGGEPLLSEPPSTAPKTWLYIAVGFVLFWMLYRTFLAPGRSTGGRALLDNTAMSAPAVYDWSLLDLDDQPVSFSKFKGKTIFLNIWATWCGPCVGEMPSIASLARDPRWQSMNVEFVCVSIDDSTDTVRTFTKGKDWTMTFLRAVRVPAVFDTDAIPATFLIASDGRIAAHEVGAADWNERHVSAFLEKLARSSLPAR